MHLYRHVYLNVNSASQCSRCLHLQGQNQEEVYREKTRTWLPQFLLLLPWLPAAELAAAAAVGRRPRWRPEWLPGMLAVLPAIGEQEVLTDFDQVIPQDSGCICGTAQPRTALDCPLLLEESSMVDTCPAVWQNHATDGTVIWLSRGQEQIAGE